MAHGYLVHEFLSPISNIEKTIMEEILRIESKFALNIAKKVRNVISENTILLAGFLQLIMLIMAGTNISQLSFVRNLNK